MIEKMKYLNITGPKNDIDRVVDTYLSKHEIHLENAMTELGAKQDVKPFVEMNPYKELLIKSQSLVDLLEKETPIASHEMSGKEAVKLITEVYSRMDQIQEKRQAIKEEKKHLTKQLNQIEPFRMLDFDLGKIQHFNFIKFRFGRISHEYYNKFTRHVYDNLNTLFYECERSSEYIWGVYFAPATASVQVDAVYSSLHFERIELEDEYEGTPEEVYQAILKKMKGVRSKNKKLRESIKEMLNKEASEILLADQTLKRLSDNFDIRKMAVCTDETNTNQVFYILCGWMSSRDTKAFIKEIADDPNIYCITQTGREDSTMKPPTKLRNPKLFRPFEMFIKMYGLPAYNEMDPTIFVALTYTFMFGIMFGDVGQGLCLAAGGFLLYKFKKMDLAAIVSVAGIWSAIFGFLYGSIFGFEDVLPALWRRPMEGIMTTLIIAVVFGVVLILVAMVLNIINALRAHDIERVLFDPSGIAGLIIYGGAAACAGLYFAGFTLPAGIILGIIFGIPLICILLREPLGNYITKKKLIFPPGSKAMFFIEAAVELFDVVLSYATNTISFVRVGAFALSHAGMMGVVLSLAGVASGHGNPIILILGNIAVAGLEGLVVGIQVLRLEYYEMFSRFYKGTGREFRPFNSKEK